MTDQIEIKCSDCGQHNTFEIKNLYYKESPSLERGVAVNRLSGEIELTLNCAFCANQMMLNYKGWILNGMEHEAVNIANGALIEHTLEFRSPLN